MYSESIKDLKAGLNKRGNNGTINISLITAQDALTILTAFHNKDIVSRNELADYVKPNKDIVRG